MAWAKAVLPDVGQARAERWPRFFVPYSELPEVEKERDREWARKAIAAIRALGDEER